MRLVKPRRDAGDDGDFAFGLRGGQHHNAFAELLLEVVDERAQLAALERIGAVREHFDALHFDGALNSFIEAAGCGLHAGLFEFAAQALEFVFLRGELGAKAFGKVVDRGDVLPGQLAPRQSRGGKCRASRGR